MNWQPIETAPKSGNRVLLYAPVREVYRSPQKQEFRIVEGLFILGHWSVWAGNSSRLIAPIEPTHWMPSPKPPQPLTVADIACGYQDAPDYSNPYYDE